MRTMKALMIGAAMSLPMAVFADEPRITVTGEGRVDAQPDLAIVTLGVTTEGATAAEAMAANSTELAAVLERLRGSGIEERDLQTTGLSLNPNWSQAEGEASRITGYTASNMLTVRVRALDGLGDALDTAVSDGANTLNGVTFDVADPKPLMDEARRLAVADALDRARLLTEAAGVVLGDVVSISESGGGMPMPERAYRMDAAASVPVAGGEVSRSANVTVVFEIDKPQQ